MFCSECLNILDINKSLNNQNNINDKILLKTFNDLSKLLDANEDLSNYKVDFLLKDIINNKKYIKYSNDIKKKINKLFDESSSNNITAEFKCHNCNFTKPLNQTSLLYQSNFDESISKTISNVKTLEENEFISKDPLLPHRNDYICKNISCLSHKQPELKDYIFYKDKNLYKVNHICCVCYYNW